MKMCRAHSLGGMINEHPYETILEQGEEIKEIFYILIVIFTFSIISQVTFCYRTFRIYRQLSKEKIKKQPLPLLIL